MYDYSGRYPTGGRQFECMHPIGPAEGGPAQLGAVPVAGSRAGGGLPSPQLPAFGGWHLRPRHLRGEGPTTPHPVRPFFAPPPAMEATRPTVPKPGLQHELLHSVEAAQCRWSPSPSASVFHFLIYFFSFFFCRLALLLNKYSFHSTLISVLHGVAGKFTGSMWS